MTRTLPTVHINGSGGGTLLDGYRNAYRALEEAIDKFHDIEFHARDYYAQGPDAFNNAKADRDAQLAKLKEIKSYLTDHYAELNFQVAERK